MIISGLAIVVLCKEKIENRIQKLWWFCISYQAIIRNHSLFLFFTQKYDNFYK
jgi:hypothetical protein